MRLTRWIQLVAAILATGALGVAAASAIVGGADAPAPPSLDPVPGSAHLDQTAPDPAGGPRWAVRVYDSVGGARCMELGRTLAGRFGRLDASGFHDIALDEGATCGDLKAEPVLLAVNAYPPRDHAGPRTVLFGVASADVADVSVTPAGSASAAHPAIGSGGGFLVALADTLAPQELPVAITLHDGRLLTFPWR